MDLQARYQNISVECSDEGRIVIVTMRRPEKRNALSLELMRELTQAFRETDSQTATVILRGEGPAFSAGHDLAELQCNADADADLQRLRTIFAACVELMETIQAISAPVIAEVGGVATAAGCQLVATCDLAVASSEARFATPGVRIGLFCSTPMVALSRAVGRKRALEMLLTGDLIDASTAQQWGLVNRVVSPERLHDETLLLARKIGEASRGIVALGKRTFYRQIDLDQHAAYAFAEKIMSENAVMADAQEGMNAFLEKRRPIWRGDSSG